MKIVKKNPKFPKKLFILTPTWNDCTCDMVYGIWNKPSQVAIPHYFVDEYKDYIDCFDFYSVSDYIAGKQEILLDINGKMFYLGKEITLEKLKNIINKLSKMKEEIIIHQPPKTNDKTQKYIDILLNKIHKICISKHVEFFKN